jgi:hypothetical protein
VVWDKGTMLDVDACILLRDLTSSIPLSTNQLVGFLSALPKLMDWKRLYAQLKKKIGKIEWSLLLVEYKSVDVEVQEGKHEKCEFYYILKIALLVELMVSCSKTDESFEPSSEISSLDKTHIFFRGIDRGGDDLIDMLRYGNPHDGNSGEYCIPTSVLKNGLEKYKNLVVTTFDKARNKIYPGFEKGAYSILTLPFQQVVDSKIETEYCCIMVEFLPSIQPSFENGSDLHFSTSRQSPDFVLTTDYDVKVFLEAAAYAKKREVPNTLIIIIHLVEGGDAGPFSINLQVQLVMERRQP